MTPLTCARVVGLLERRAVGLAEGERLLTESHLAECAGCREQSKLLEAVRRAAPAGAEPVLSAPTRELLLKRAFELATAPAEKTARRSSAFMRPAAAGLLAFAALALLWLGGKRDHRPERAADSATPETGRLST